MLVSDDVGQASTSTAERASVRAWVRAWVRACKQHLCETVEDSGTEGSPPKITPWQCATQTDRETIHTQSMRAAQARNPLSRLYGRSPIPSPIYGSGEPIRQGWAEGCVSGSAGQKSLDQSAVRADEGMGDRLVPLGLHACRTGEFHSHPSPMEVVAGAMRALEVAPVDLDAVGFFGQRFHGHPGGGLSMDIPAAWHDQHESDDRMALNPSPRGAVELPPSALNPCPRGSGRR